MRVAFLRGELVESVLEIAPDQIERYMAAYGCDRYLVAPIDDPALRAVGEGAKLAGAASRVIPGSREIDRTKLPAVTPAAQVAPAELAALVDAREAAIGARLVELTAGDELRTK